MIPHLLTIMCIWLSVYSGYKSYSTSPNRNILNISGLSWTLNSVGWGGLGIAGLEALFASQISIYAGILFGALGYIRAMSNYKIKSNINE